MKMLRKPGSRTAMFSNILVDFFFKWKDFKFLPETHVNKTIESTASQPGVVVHTCNHRYLGG
jgi:hypothetical protein